MSAIKDGLNIASRSSSKNFRTLNILWFI